MKMGEPNLKVHKDTMVGMLSYSDTQIAIGTMGYKHKALDNDNIKESLEAPNFLLKTIPHVDGKPRICEIVQYSLTDIKIKGGWSGPGELDLHPYDWHR